jgi:mannose-1-phosphate guanylyltransferase
MDIPSISIDYAVMERSKKNKSGIPHNLTGLI